MVILETIRHLKKTIRANVDKSLCLIKTIEVIFPSKYFRFISSVKRT